MIKKINQAIPAKSLGYMLMCGGIILIIVLGLISFHRYNATRIQDVKKLENQIKEQKGFEPVYQAMLKELDKKEVYELPNPRKVTLPRQDIEKFQETVRQAAGKAGLVPVSVLPDVKTMTGASATLLVNATLKGELLNFRKFVVSLGAVPYVDQIEEVNVKQFGDAMEFKTKIWVVVSN